MKDIFLEEYNSPEAVAKYSKTTAGSGISYLLEHEYGSIYLDVLRKYVAKSAGHDGARILEFGCGAGMNVLHMVSLLQRSGIPLKDAFGTDFSKALINAANQAADDELSNDKRDRVRFLWGRNESLIEDLAAGLNVGETSI